MELRAKNEAKNNETCYDKHKDIQHDVINHNDIQHYGLYCDTQQSLNCLRQPGPNVLKHFTVVIY